MIAVTPIPPYYAVVFTSVMAEECDGYAEMGLIMTELASSQKGFLGVESVKDDIGITVSYWKDEQSILNWKNNMEHLLAQEKGRSDWYQYFKVRIAKVERDYEFKK